MLPQQRVNRRSDARIWDEGHINLSCALSLVRNNQRAGLGALGFLRDKRRMNVALSRAKSQLVIVGSLSFLREAVRGVNPDASDHALSFLTDIADTIDELCGERRGKDKLPLAQIISPEAVRLRK
jgi:AAA domain